MKKRKFIMAVVFIICFGFSALPVLGNETEKTNNQSIIQSFLGLFKGKKDAKKDFGIYQKHTPFIKDLIDYASTHSLPNGELSEIRDIAQKDNVPVDKIFVLKDTTYIMLTTTYYFKLLQNTVAIYSKVLTYHIDFDLKGNATCVGKDSRGYTACQKMGGINPKPNKRIPTWLAYELPQNIFDE
jgi:hypothetical protein